jgi:uncharacterized cupin superfamily protein
VYRALRVMDALEGQQCQQVSPEVMERLWSGSPWPQWTTQPSIFTWGRFGPRAIYVVHGMAIISPQEGSGVPRSILVQKGDLVIFPHGLVTQWDVRTAFTAHWYNGQTQVTGLPQREEPDQEGATHEQSSLLGSRGTQVPQGLGLLESTQVPQLTVDSLRSQGPPGSGSSPQLLHARLQGGNAPQASEWPGNSGAEAFRGGLPPVPPPLATDSGKSGQKRARLLSQDQVVVPSHLRGWLPLSDPEGRTYWWNTVFDYVSCSYPTRPAGAPRPQVEEAD